MCVERCDREGAAVTDLMVFTGGVETGGAVWCDVDAAFLINDGFFCKVSVRSITSSWTESCRSTSCPHYFSFTTLFGMKMKFYILQSNGQVEWIFNQNPTSA